MVSARAMERYRASRLWAFALAIIISRSRLGPGLMHIRFVCASFRCWAVDLEVLVVEKHHCH